MFNKSQIQAISHMDGPAMVLAGPGSVRPQLLSIELRI